MRPPRTHRSEPAAAAASPARGHPAAPASEPPPPGQRAATRALKLPARQPPLDLNRVRPYREHSASERYTALPGALSQETPGGPPHAPIGKVPPPTNSHAPGTSRQHHRCTQCRKNRRPRKHPQCRSTGWAAELGLTGSDAINRVTQSGGRRQQHDRDRERPNPRRRSPPGRVGATTGNLDSADVPRRILDPAPPGDNSVAATSQDPHGGRLAYSVDEAARITGLSRDLLYDEMRRGNLASIKIGRRRLITRQHLEQFLDIAS